MKENNKNNLTWNSMFGFIMSSIGYAVGLGAIWRFPYMVGTNGGGVFLVLIIILALIVAVPLITAELSLGRYAQKTAIVGMREISKSKGWAVIGWLGVVAATIMMSYYINLTSTVAVYVFKAFKNDFNNIKIGDTQRIYTDLIQNGWLIMLISALLCVFLYFIISKGVKRGIEKYSKYVMVTLFAFLIILAINSCTLDNAIVGIKWFFRPDFSKITPKVILNALSQVFFFAGIGLSTAFAFGSYLPEKNSDIPTSAAVIVFSNMFVAVLAGLVIFPAIFSFGMEPAVGSSLVFQTMPMIFGHMNHSWLFAGLFFMLLFFAALTSCIGLVEGIVSTISQRFNISRKITIIIVSLIILILSILPTLSFSSLKNIEILGYNLFEFMDFLCVSVLIPIGGLLICIYTVYFFKFKKFKEESNMGARVYKVSKIYKILLGFIIPVLIIIVMFTGI